MTDNTCRTCKTNEYGFCNRMGRFVKDTDSCEKHRDKSEPTWQQAFMRTFLAENRKSARIYEDHGTREE